MSTAEEASGSEIPAAEPERAEAGSGPAAKSTLRAANVPLPSLDQMTATRAAHWHQDEKPLLTLEAVRAWVNRCGLVVYGPRAQQLGAPAPSLVEATLGKRLDAAAETSGMEAARTLLARLVAEGGAVPLNLLGAAGGLGTDVPDYVASAAVFSYIFTLRGNKAWKQAPVTSGAVKVSPLALATYEMLSAKVTLSAYDLATQLGKEVTEGAVLRALTELWGQLRVVPVTQVDGSATLWELTTARFTKQIKAGANAGQPSALSALISLYLGQAVAATEDEIETFLSPLAARSRVRDVIHALLSARQLETIVVEGKTLLHVTGELPEFAGQAKAEPAAGEAEGSGSEGSGSRISKFAAKPGSKIGTGLRSKPAGKPGFGPRPAYGSKPVDRERRPFKREGGPGAAKPRFDRPRFDKPWNEGPPAVPAGEDVPRLEAAEERPAGPREFTPRPYAPKSSGFKSGAPRPYKPASGAAGEGPRKTFSKPGTFGRKREGFAARPGGGREAGGGDARQPRREFGGGDARPPRREFGARPERRERPAGGERAGGVERPGPAGYKRASAGPYSARPKFGTGSGARPGAKSGSKPGFGGKPSGAGRPAFGDRPPASRDRGPAAPRADDAVSAPRKVFRKFDAPRDKKPFSPRSGEGKSFGAKRTGSGDRPARSFDAPRAERSRTGFAGGAGKKPGGDFAKSGGPFAKFADGKKPFRKPGPGKKAPGAKPDGGFKPTRRKRPEGNE